METNIVHMITVAMLGAACFEAGSKRISAMKDACLGMRTAWILCTLGGFCWILSSLPDVPFTQFFTVGVFLLGLFAVVWAIADRRIKSGCVPTPQRRGKP
jgi:hypothetical protein